MPYIVCSKYVVTLTSMSICSPCPLMLFQICPFAAAKLTIPKLSEVPSYMTCIFYASIEYLKLDCYILVPVATVFTAVVILISSWLVSCSKLGSVNSHWSHVPILCSGNIFSYFLSYIWVSSCVICTTFVSFQAATICNPFNNYCNIFIWIYFVSVSISWMMVTASQVLVCATIQKFSRLYATSWFFE